MNDKTGILCIGEVLWDALPSGLYLGGAPLNVCYHLNQLGIKSEIASKVGNDRLGKEAIRRIKQKGMSSEYIQIDQEAETGFVCVELDENRDPNYNFVKPVAWDHMELSRELEDAVEHAWGLVFGSLAQRSDPSRATIQKLWEFDTRKIFDMNLRQPHVNREVVKEALEVADIIKMNEEELIQLKDWYSLPEQNHRAVEELFKQFESSIICITRGEEGAILFQEGEWFEHKGFSIKAKDGVGAGDAFVAAMLYGIQEQKRGRELLAYANAAGALVAQKDGATPVYTVQDVLDLIEEA